MTHFKSGDVWRQTYAYHKHRHRDSSALKQALVNGTFDTPKDTERQKERQRETERERASR